MTAIHRWFKRAKWWLRNHFLCRSPRLNPSSLYVTNDIISQDDETTHVQADRENDDGDNGSDAQSLTAASDGSSRISMLLFVAGDLTGAMIQAAVEAAAETQQGLESMVNE